MLSVLLRQIAIMALLSAVGVMLSRRGFLSSQGTKELGNLLLRIVIPCVIVNSYITEFSRERLLRLALSAGLAVAGLVLAMVVSWLVYKTRRPIENFAAAFCNAGFIGIPLVQAVIGTEGVFYAAAVVAALNLFQWTYGVYLLTGSREAVSLKTVAKNPVVIAILIGILLFTARVSVPEVVKSTLGYIAGMNTPVAMILTGTYLARLPLKKLLDRRAVGCVLMRLTGIPLLTLGLFWLLRPEPTVAMATLLALSTPVGANICVFAQQYDSDYELSVVTVCTSTVLSVVTVPLLASLGQLVL